MKMRLKLFVVLASLLLVMLPVCFAEENTTEEKVAGQRQNAPAYVNFPGLTSSIAALLVSAGFAYVAIGAAVIVGGYVIYRITKYTWTYYRLYSYSKWYDDHSYIKHIVNKYDFDNIWGGRKPTQAQFEKKCKDTINSKSKNVRRYLQRSNSRTIAYDLVTKMIVVGEKDGKTIVTCYKDTTGELTKNTIGKNPNWIIPK